VRRDVLEREGGSYDVGYMPVPLEFTANPGEGFATSHGMLDGWGFVRGWGGRGEGERTDAFGGADGVPVETEGLLSENEVLECRRGRHCRPARLPNWWNHFKTRNLLSPAMASPSTMSLPRPESPSLEQTEEEQAAIKALVDSFAKSNLHDAKHHPSKTPGNPPGPRPMRLYSRGQLLRLYKSPLVQLPPNMPELRQWFGFVLAF
jgi:hypothetical protein